MTMRPDVLSDWSAMTLQIMQGAAVIEMNFMLLAACILTQD